MSDGELTALSQYNFYCCFNHFQDKARTEALIERMREYWATRVKPLLQSLPAYSSYIVDFGVLRTDDGGAEVSDAEVYAGECVLSKYEYERECGCECECECGV